MLIHLAYGKTGLPIDLPEERNDSVIEVRYVLGLPILYHSLCPAHCSLIDSHSPRDIMMPEDKVGIIIIYKLG